MQDDFITQYNRLNTAQRQAVDTIDGPVLVIAGPGTGKTQLLTARVANILNKTDTGPQNILCLTFTESAAANMRERLTRFIGQDAYSVQIGTYHSFGSDIINRYPQYFTTTRLQNPVDELGRHQILEAIVETLEYTNPLKQLRHHIGDLISTISDVKRALLTPDKLQAIAAENLTFIQGASSRVTDILDGLKRMPSTAAKSIPLFEEIHLQLGELEPAKPVDEHHGSLARAALESLEVALESARDLNKSTPLSAWKNKWLAKDAQDAYIFDGQLENQRIQSLAKILELYESALSERGLYDFDDMILRTVKMLEEHDELRYTLQEQYLYILLDEFQDTNAAQFRLIQLLTNNPVNEGRPNVMAVGDDDQAIYAFQGALYSNMADFYTSYKNVKLINLSQNYRSHKDILETAQNIASQISARLGDRLQQQKILEAANTSLKSAVMRRQELTSDTAHNAWIATSIAKLLEQGVDANEIAVLAPKHKHLMPIVEHLANLNISVSYEKRENILEAKVIRQLLVISELVQALAEQKFEQADALWPEVLSYDFWNIPTDRIWKLSWQITQARAEQPSNWTLAILENPDFALPGNLITKLALIAPHESVETMLDYITGTIEYTSNDTVLVSPLKAFYTSIDMMKTEPDAFYQTVSHLRVLRAKLREHQKAREDVLTIKDLLDFVAMYRAAGQAMLDTSPYSQNSQSVQLLTAFKAKGLEFEHVFIACCHDDTWGSTSRSNTNRLTLPPNLSPIRHAGATDDERLRLLYVAVTRAKIGLYLSSFVSDYGGKRSRAIKYFDEQELPDGSRVSRALPEQYQAIHVDTTAVPELESLEIDWRTRHTTAVSDESLQALLKHRLLQYQLSPTHLNQFVDLMHGGPEQFLFTTLLRFPQAPSVSGQFGSSIHESLEWVQHKVTESGTLPALDDTLKHFELRLLSKRLLPKQYSIELLRGKRALQAYLADARDKFKPTDKAEHNFRNEGVAVGEARLTGKIDKLEIDRTNKTITVVDYKTGQPYKKWEQNAKLHKYRQQLYIYKLLIENSRTFAGYSVTRGRLDFVEPNQDNQIISLDLLFDDQESKHISALIMVVWQRIQALDFSAEIPKHPTLKDILAFESELLDQ